MAVLIAFSVVLLSAVRAGAAPPTVVRLVIDGAITNSTGERLTQALHLCGEKNAQALVIQLDTPGGVLDATREMVRKILDSRVPVITYVSPRGARAGSAGLFITLASHVAAMAPSTNIGASHPVSMFGGNVEGDMGKKVANDAAAWARSLAETRGRNTEQAEKAVKESASFTAHEAIDGKLVDLEADNLDDLLRKVDGRTVTVLGRERTLHTRNAAVVLSERSGRQALYDWLANPTLLYLLLLLGILGIYIEFQHPGLIVPGLLGAACLGIVFGLQILPINTFGALLIGLAAVCFFAEVYVTSFGVLAAAGLACLVVGSYLLFDVEGSTFRLAPRVIWTVAITFGLIFIFIGTLLVRAKRQGPTSGVEALIGRSAVASEAIPADGTGRIFFDGTYWTATADHAIPKGARVRVEKLEGLSVRVSLIDEKGTVNHG